MRRGLLAVTLAAVWALVGTGIAGAVVPVPGTVTSRYRSITRPTLVWPDRPGEMWDLTACDLEVSYQLSMGSYRPPLGTTDWTSVGVGNYPDYRGWMSSGAPYAAEVKSQSLDMDDKFNLGAPGRLDESSYDATDPDTLVTPPIGTSSANYGIWFDRTGVDALQALLWGSVKNATYNTRGIYRVSVRYHAVDSDTATMFARVNGVQAGFYAGSWFDGPPDYYPVGKSFDADLENLRVFAAVLGSRVFVSNWQATGCR